MNLTVKGWVYMAKSAKGIWFRDIKQKEKTYQEKMRKATANCLFAEANRYCSLDQTQMQPPSKWAITWASAKRVAAAKPSLKAW